MGDCIKANNYFSFYTFLLLVPQLIFANFILSNAIHDICRLTITQLVLACIIFVLHAATTAMNDHFNTVAAPIEDQLNYLYWSFSDEAATGVWVGIVVSIVPLAIKLQWY